MTERIPIILVRSLSVRNHSLKRPDALVVSLLGGELARDGATVSQPILPRRFLIAIAANGLIDRVQAVDLLWGDRSDGGPNDVMKSVSTIVFQAREAGAALGLMIEVEWGIGWRCRPLRRALRVPENNADSSAMECPVAQ
jgi:hypothetical protein